MSTTDPSQSHENPFYQHPRDRQHLAATAMESSRSVDGNLAALCEHIQVEGFSGGIFSDVVVQALGATFHLHRLVLSRSSYFRNMLHGPWKEAGALTLSLQIDDDNISQEAVTMALAYLYGHYPKLNDNNAFRVLAVASFLDLQDLCGICTDFITSELWTTNFLAYQIFSESHDYGIHGERVRNACWGYLCQCATVELRQVLPRLSSRTLHTLLTSDELWVPSEEKRFELALYTLLARDTLSASSTSDSASLKGKNLPESGISVHLIESALQCMNMQNDGLEGYEGNCLSVLQGSRHSIKAENFAYLHSSFPCSNPISVHNSDERRKPSGDISLTEGPSSDCNTYSSERKLGQNVLELSVKGKTVIPGEEYESFNIIFEGDSLLYCHMSFEALLNARKQLEELGFPCKSVNDGLWLQMLLSHRVQEIAADTCISCCTVMAQCTCLQPYAYHRQEHGRNNGSQMRNMYMPNAQSNGNAYFAPVRVHVRGPIDGLAGIGHRPWTPARLVFSRVPLGVGHGNEESESRVSSTGDLGGDGLTAVVGLSDGRGGVAVHAEQSDSMRAVPQFSGSGGISMLMMESSEGDVGIGWEDSSGSSLSWDLKTALRHFPPFRFGVEFEEVHRLADGQVKHSPEVFYAGSLWKVSVQAFSNEYPQGRSTVGLFLHRRKAEATEYLKKAHMYVDSREKVTARYQLICPSKREVMTVGSFKDSGTLLPKAPKGWGCRTALLFDELPDLLQGGALRVVAVVQLV